MVGARGFEPPTLGPEPSDRSSKINPGQVDQRSRPTPIPAMTALAVRTLDTIRTIGQIVPGPIQNRLAVRPVMEPAHNAVARAHGDRVLHDPTHSASRNSTATVHATPVPEFSHQPVHACMDAALTAPINSGTSVSDGDVS